MKISSPAFENNQPIPQKYSGDGENVNPPLIITDVPENAKSLALIVDDPDAPMGTFTHWLMWNIDPSIREIGEEDWPDGAEQGLNDRGELGYTGPRPPSGIHRYFFKLFALTKKLDLPGDVSKEKLEKEIKSSLIEKAELMGVYSA
ncbi:MAG: YbhB/YbcL family Raf kinase inhibitor-like protein [Candidatus Levybacteria bacterium]|nr:YbhB/YbcL family Raf kinase inhibitor-like protein [Candidatus Levybacteria bacterium]MBI2420519.1 YbhB/YbcL family Raf kinase inhibitor-like protein [Candidatus Levybacteria bacterium]